MKSLLLIFVFLFNTTILPAQFVTVDSCDIYTTAIEALGDLPNDYLPNKRFEYYVISENTVTLYFLNAKFDSTYSDYYTEINNQVFISMKNEERERNYIGIDSVLFYKKTIHRRSYSHTCEFNLNYPVKILTQDEYEEIFVDDGCSDYDKYLMKLFQEGYQYVYDEFYRRYPGASGFIRFSEIVISSDKQRALLLIDYMQGSLAGRGMLVQLQYVDNRWEIEYKYLVWQA